ncbi:MAG: crossover junction endodeoxyribonuclease RuvC [Mariprofundaceae bacterium]|nr:crossover junction endodeoxyribonuclease RuvC [Mariprofundaceae bacterium]
MDSYSPSTFYLIGIDPGNNTGIAIYELDCNTKAVISIVTHTVVLDNLVTNRNEVLLNRNAILSSVCKKLSSTYTPIVLAMESAFLNSRFPKAVMQLSQYTSTVEQAFYGINSFIKIHRYPPKYIKKYIGAGGNADKDAMTLAVKALPEISARIDLDRVTEHEIDALAAGYIAVSYVRQYPHTLIEY